MQPRNRCITFHSFNPVFPDSFCRQTSLSLKLFVNQYIKHTYFFQEVELVKYIPLEELDVRRLELALPTRIHAFLQSHWQKAAGSRAILLVALAGRWLAWLTSFQLVPLGSWGDNQHVSLPAFWLPDQQMDLQAAWLAACLALLLPAGCFTCCPASQMPGRLPSLPDHGWGYGLKIGCSAKQESAMLVFCSHPIWNVPWSRNSHPSKL